VGFAHTDGMEVRRHELLGSRVLLARLENLLPLAPLLRFCGEVTRRGFQVYASTVSIAFALNCERWAEIYIRR